MGFKFVYDSINLVINFRKNVCYKNLQHKVYCQKIAHSALKSELQEKKDSQTRGAQYYSHFTRIYSTDKSSVVQSVHLLSMKKHLHHRLNFKKKLEIFYCGFVAMKYVCKSVQIGKYCISSRRHKKQLHFFDTLHSHSKQNKYICCVKKGIKLCSTRRKL